MDVHDGNKADKEGFMEVIKSYKNALKSQNKEEERKGNLWVVDNALYTQQNIKDMTGVTLWLSRAGHNLLWVQSAYQSSSQGVWQSVKGSQGYIDYLKNARTIY